MKTGPTTPPRPPERYEPEEKMSAADILRQHLPNMLPIQQRACRAVLDELAATKAQLAAQAPFGATNPAGPPVVEMLRRLSAVRSFAIELGVELDDIIAGRATDPQAVADRLAAAVGAPTSAARNAAIAELRAQVERLQAMAKAERAASEAPSAAPQVDENAKTIPVPDKSSNGVTDPAAAAAFRKDLEEK